MSNLELYTMIALVALIGVLKIALLIARFRLKRKIYEQYVQNARKP